MKQLREITLIAEKEDYVTVSLPLLIRLMEWAREDAFDDMALHYAAENAMKIGGHLTMDHYEKLIKQNNK